YGYSLFMFVLSFILFYLLISRSGVYFFYIVISFILYPFAKVLFDWLFVFKVRHALDTQKGITYYFDLLMFLFDYIVCHVSLLILHLNQFQFIPVFKSFVRLVVWL